MFLDGDDYLENTAVQRLVAEALRLHTDVIKFCSYVFVDGNKEETLSWEVYRYKQPYNEVNRGVDLLEKQFLIDNNPSACHMFFSRDFLKEHGINFAKGILHEDNLFHFQVMAKAQRVSIYNQPLYYYRLSRDGSITSNPNWKRKCEGFVFTAEQVESYIANDKILKRSKMCKWVKFFTGAAFEAWKEMNKVEETRDDACALGEKISILMRENICWFSFHTLKNYFTLAKAINKKRDKI